MPTLILLDGTNGSVVTRGGVERTIGDPNGAEFPWRPPHPKAALEDGPLLPCGARDTNEPMLHEELRHCFKGVYFSAHWVYRFLVRTNFFRTGIQNSVFHVKVGNNGFDMEINTRTTVPVTMTAFGSFVS